jgi:hypothetical protein
MLQVLENPLIFVFLRFENGHFMLGNCKIHVNQNILVLN